MASDRDRDRWNRGDYREREDRNFAERIRDEVRSWFGDDDDDRGRRIAEARHDRWSSTYGDDAGRHRDDVGYGHPRGGGNRGPERYERGTYGDYGEMAQEGTGWSSERSATGWRGGDIHGGGAGGRYGSDLGERYGSGESYSGGGQGQDRYGRSMESDWDGSNRGSGRYGGNTGRDWSERSMGRGRYGGRMGGGRYGGGGGRYGNRFGGVQDEPTGGMRSDGPGAGRRGGSYGGYDRWGASEWSEQAARSEGPYAGMGPSGYKRSAERILEEINEELTWAGHLDASQIRVNVEGDEVTLEGSVDSRMAKRAAEEIAESVRGVRDVHNRLRVEARQSGWGSGGSSDRSSGDHRGMGPQSGTTGSQGRSGSQGMSGSGDRSGLPGSGMQGGTGTSGSGMQGGTGSSMQDRTGGQGSGMQDRSGSGSQGSSTQDSTGSRSGTGTNRSNDS